MILTFTVILSISHDDGFIINKLGGPLKLEYESITYYSMYIGAMDLAMEYTKDRPNKIGIVKI